MKTYLFLFLAICTLSGCNNDDNTSLDDCPITFETAYVESANAPASGIVGENIAIDVLFNVKNGCGSFNAFEESIMGNSRTIIVSAKYEGCFCTQAIVNLNAIYNFKADVAGEYELKFKSGENDYVLVTISIQ